jgi:hypothetical protein
LKKVQLGMLMTTLKKPYKKNNRIDTFKDEWGKLVRYQIFAIEYQIGMMIVAIFSKLANIPRWLII